MALLINRVREHLEEAQGFFTEESEGDIQAVLENRMAQLDAVELSEDVVKQMDAVYKARNVIRLLLSGIEVDGERLVKFANDTLTGVEPLPVARKLIRGLARQLYNSARAQGDDKLVISGAKRNLQILEEIARMCIEDGVDFSLDIVNDRFKVILVNGADANGLQDLAKEEMALYDGIGARVEVRANAGPGVDFNSDQLNQLGDFQSRLSSTFKSGERHYCITIIPTEEDAELDGMDYLEYLQLFFEACDQPWEAIEVAQAQLIERFDSGDEVRVINDDKVRGINDDKTDISFNIKGQTFANSVTLKNIPGAEIFSSALRESVTGILVAKGVFKYGNHTLIEDIELTFDKGRVMGFRAAEGAKTLHKILYADHGKGDGSLFTGELGFGTNPHLRRQFVNALLTEKVGQSFHVALGDPYKYTEYNGVPVKVDNGNRSASGIHWDITTMLGGKNGQIILDGKVVQRNGIWVEEDGKTPSEALKVLNEGWGALPEEQQPDWWKERYPDGYET